MMYYISYDGFLYYNHDEDDNVIPRIPRDSLGFWFCGSLSAAKKIADARFEEFEDQMSQYDDIVIYREEVAHPPQDEDEVSHVYNCMEAVRGFIPREYNSKCTQSDITKTILCPTYGYYAAWDALD